MPGSGHAGSGGARHGSSRHAGWLPAIAIALAAVLAVKPANAWADPVIVAAGDIACSPASPDFNRGAGTSTKCRQAATAGVAQGQSASAVLELGDEQYYCGLLDDFNASYDRSWGSMKQISYPVPGNHEYGVGVLKQNCPQSHAEGYFSYFGARAGSSTSGYYAYDVGTWRMIALNSECSIVACGSGSAQERWLTDELASHSSTCTLAYFHRPLFSSASGTEAPSVAPLWQALYRAKADVILNGHAHNYERFAPQDPSHRPITSGIREFVVGTGGVEHGGFTSTAPNSQLRNSNTYGVLKLTLHPTSYTWKFLPVPGQTFTDSGTGSCH